MEKSERFIGRNAPPQLSKVIREIEKLKNYILPKEAITSVESIEEQVTELMAELGKQPVTLKRWKSVAHHPKAVALESRQETYLDVKEVAQLFGVSETAVYKWIKAGKIEYYAPPVEGGRGYRIPLKQFESRLKQFKKLDIDALRENRQKHLLEDGKYSDPQIEEDEFENC